MSETKNAKLIARYEPRGCPIPGACASAAALRESAEREQTLAAERVDWARCFTLNGVTPWEWQTRAEAAKEREHMLRDACKGLLGLLQLIVQNREDVSDELRDILRTNHRVVDAIAVLADAPDAMSAPSGGIHNPNAR